MRPLPSRVTPAVTPAAALMCSTLWRQLERARSAAVGATGTDAAASDSAGV